MGHGHYLRMGMDNFSRVNMSPRTSEVRMHPCCHVEPCGNGRLDIETGSANENRRLKMKQDLLMSHCVFPSPDIEKTADFYTEVMGFRAVRYLNAKEPHICLYRDHTEIILTSANTDRVFPNRILYGYGYDAYFITNNQQALQDELTEKGAKIVRPLQKTDYQNREFVAEDIDGRWIGFGIKKE